MLFLKLSCGENNTFINDMIGTCEVESFVAPHSNCLQVTKCPCSAAVRVKEKLHKEERFTINVLYFSLLMLLTKKRAKFTL